MGKLNNRKGNIMSFVDIIGGDLSVDTDTFKSVYSMHMEYVVEYLNKGYDTPLWSNNVYLFETIHGFIAMVSKFNYVKENEGVTRITMDDVEFINDLDIMGGFRSIEMTGNEVKIFLKHKGEMF